MSSVKILEESSSANPLVLRLQQILISCSRVILPHFSTIPVWFPRKCNKFTMLKISVGNQIKGNVNNLILSLFFPSFVWQSIETGDLHKSGSSVSELVNYLDSISDAALSDTSNEESRNNALEVLSEIHLYICQPLLDQVCFIWVCLVSSIVLFCCWVCEFYCVHLKAVVDALSFELPKAVAKFACVSGKCLEIVESIVNQFVATCSPRDLIPIFCEVCLVKSIWSLLILLHTRV